jgi:hypothetical protein
MIVGLTGAELRAAAIFFARNVPQFVLQAKSADVEEFPHETGDTGNNPKRRVWWSSTNRPRNAGKNGL